MGRSEKRTTTVMISVRLTAAERDEIAAARDRAIAGVPGAKLGLGTYLLGAGLAVARGQLVRRLTRADVSPETLEDR